MKKLLVGGLAAVAVASFSVLPASAIPVGGTMSPNQDPVHLGESVTIANDPGDENTCLSDYDDNPVAVNISVYDPSTELLVADAVAPDVDGNWSFTLEPDELGVYEVSATCAYTRILTTVQQLAWFEYSDTSFEVIEAPATTTTTAPEGSTTTAAPSTSTTTAKGATGATPRFAG